MVTYYAIENSNIGSTMAGHLCDTDFWHHLINSSYIHLSKYTVGIILLKAAASFGKVVTSKRTSTAVYLILIFVNLSHLVIMAGLPCHAIKNKNHNHSMN